MRPPHLSVVVVHYRGAEMLRRCLDSLARQVEQPVEVVLVFNGVPPDEPAPGPLPGMTRVVRLKRNEGFAGGANAGIRASSGELIALLNDDAEAEPQWAAALVEAARANPWAGFFASRVVSAQDGRMDSAGDLLTRFGEGANRGRGQPDAAPYTEDAEVFGACACASMYRKGLLARIGLFDERYFHSYEDFDLSARARLAGERCLYVAAARVRHVGAATRGATSRQSIYLQARNSERAFWSNLPGKVLWPALPWHLARDVWGLVAQGRRGHAGPYLRGKAAAFLELPRLLALRRKRVRLAIGDLAGQVDPDWHLVRLRQLAARLDIFGRAL